MEVHHHPEVEKKRLKDYLLEGLMIFIAVMMGFFAESLREHIASRDKEEAYIHSLINNLQQDTTDIKYCITVNNYKVRELDSLFALSTQSLSNNNIRTQLYKYANRGISLTSVFGSNDATMMQLKNAGGLQYITRRHMADSIAMYDQQIRSVYGSEIPYANTINDAMNAMSSFMVFSVITDTAYVQHGVFTGKPLPLMNDSPASEQLFFNKISLEEGWTKNYLDNLKELLPSCTRLIVLLKKEYSMD